MLYKSASFIYCCYRAKRSKYAHNRHYKKDSAVRVQKLSSSSSSSSSSSAPISEHSRLHSWRHFERSCAHAVLRPRLWGRRLSSIVRSHVRLGRSTCPAAPIRWRMIDGCSKNARVVLWWVGSRRMSEQTKSFLCDNCSTPHFFVGDMRRIWNMNYTAKTPLVKSIETSIGGHRNYKWLKYHWALYSTRH